MVKAQFKSADTFGAKVLITLGESEIESKQVTVKNNQTREELIVDLNQIQEDFQAIFKQVGF